MTGLGCIVAFAFALSVALATLFVLSSRYRA